MTTGGLSPSEQALLRRFLDRLLAGAAPASIAWVKVFGSRAQGLSHEQSELDAAVQAAPGADRLRLRNLTVGAA